MSRLLKVSEPGSPVLITGSQRSGTTWVAKVLSHSSSVAFVDEPFNPDYHPSRVSPSFARWFQYVCDENSDEFAERLSKAFHLRYPLRQVTSLRDRGEWRRFGTEAVTSAAHRLRSDTVVCKDPIAVFSVPWLVERYGFRVVACVRHPAAFVSSQLKLGWEFDFNNFLEQPLFMRDCAGEFAEDIERLAAVKASAIDGAILLWRIIYSRVRSYQIEHPDWTVIRHEDLSGSPLARFEELSASCGLSWTPDMARYADRSSNSDNPSEVPVDQWNSVTRNSEATARIWHTRLSADEIMQVRAGTEREAAWFYADDDWGGVDTKIISST